MHGIRSIPKGAQPQYIAKTYKSLQYFNCGDTFDQGSCGLTLVI